MEYISALLLLMIILSFVAIRRRWSSYVKAIIYIFIFVSAMALVVSSWQYFLDNKMILFAFVLACALLALGILWFGLNTRARSQLKVKLAKSFSLYKYDYRESWLGFNSALDFAHQEENFYPKTIKALADMVASGGGKLWSKSTNRFIFRDHWNSPLINQESFNLPDNLIEFMDKTNWVIDVNEYKKDPEVYRQLKLDLVPFEQSSIKIFVPLRRENELVAIVGLKSLDDTQNLNWEDHDLLKAAGQQMASYIDLYEATSSLYEQREFAAFNRLSTFVVHDLKNVSAQLELITQNASKFGDNPEFVKDSFETVTSANQRLSKMLSQLQRKDNSKKSLSKVFLPDLVEQLSLQVDSLTGVENVPAVYVLGSQEQLSNIILHLEENAQQALMATETKEGINSLEGVKHLIEKKNNDIYWHIIDQGVGMSEEFMREKLFKPFETTKGNAGMGVGVYQCRYLLRSNDGDLIIRSRLGEGTQCTAILSIISDDKIEVEITGEANEPK